MPLYICILINKHNRFFYKKSHLNEVFIVISITAWVNVRPHVLFKTEIHTEKKLRQELPAGTSHTIMHTGFFSPKSKWLHVHLINSFISLIFIKNSAWVKVHRINHCSIAADVKYKTMVDTVTCPERLCRRLTYTQC